MPLPYSCFLQVNGAVIYNGGNEITHLRGLCLGGRMNMQNFISGDPRIVTAFSVPLEHSLEKDRAGFSSICFLRYYSQEDDMTSSYRFCQSPHELATLPR